MQIIPALFDLVMAVGAVVVVLVAIFLFLKAVTKGEGVANGIKKLWSTLWKYLP